jgi:hypothetical protein
MNETDSMLDQLGGVESSVPPRSPRAEGTEMPLPSSFSAHRERDPEKERAD